MGGKSLDRKDFISGNSFVSFYNCFEQSKCDTKN